MTRTVYGEVMISRPAQSCSRIPGEQQWELSAIAGDLLPDLRVLGYRHADPVDGDTLDRVMAVADREPPIP